MHTALQTTFIKFPPKFLDPVRYALNAKHDGCAMEKPYVGWIEYYTQFHKTIPPQESESIPEAVNSEGTIWKTFIKIRHGEGELRI